mmetsp:Transcript_1422/g.3018  ORF Transcript_1422/g.3018 Transcript_1422/m.3018 type:complete len:559 (-) Transcript_1422:15-1691(-)
MRVSLVIPSVVFAARLRAAKNVDVGGVDSGDHQVWIPITPVAEQAYFYNPVQGISVHTLPAGAVATRVPLELIHGNSQLHLHNGTAGPAHPTLVPEQQRKSCVPHCMWNCTEPVCEENCKPECAVPACQTQCPKNRAGAFVGCKVRCGEPNCAMYCPPDPCQGRKTLDCVTPKCTTHCEKPKCSVDCGHSSFGCQTVCPTPACEWKCSKPTCPKPQCSMQCEASPKCGQTMSVAPPGADELVVGKKEARLKTPEWKTGQWGSCSNQCGPGTQTRKVICSAGEESFCTGKKPATAKACEEVLHCQYQVGLWSTCSNKCGKGTRSRAVTCSNKDVHECLDPKPAEAEPCDDVGPHCERCQVQLFGGPEFDGWNVTLPQGSFNTDDLIARGVKCEETSSVRVLGTCCEASLFQYGDFNRRNKGWHLKLVEGDYTADQLSERGADDNDLSSLKVHHRPRCGNGKTDHMFRPPKEGVEGEQLEEEDKATQTDGDPFAGIAASSTADDDERPRRQRGGVSTTSTTTKAPEADPYPWWFWLIIALLLIGVVGAIALAARGRQNRL